MIHIPVSRWGEPYQSSESDKIVHFDSGEVVAEMSRAVAPLVAKDMRLAPRARDVLREIPIKELLQKVKKAGELYAKAELPCGDGSQTAAQFARMRTMSTKARKLSRKTWTVVDALPWRLTGMRLMSRRYFSSR